MKEYMDKDLFLASMGLSGDETKYGNRDAEHQSRSYSTYMAYEILDSVDDAIAADVVERSSFEAVAQKYAKIQDKLIRGELVERKRGKWTTTDTLLGKCCVCSVCGSCPTMEYKFCPYCGADMREVDHETD